MENLDNPQESYVVIFRTELTPAEAVNAVGGLNDLRVIMMHRPTQMLAVMAEKDFAAFAGLQKLPSPPASEHDRMIRIAEEREKLRSERKNG